MYTARSFEQYFQLKLNSFLRASKWVNDTQISLYVSDIFLMIYTNPRF